MRITKRLKVGSLITCKGDKDLRKSLKELKEHGYKAAKCGNYNILIEALPKEETDGENQMDKP